MNDISDFYITEADPEKSLNSYPTFQKSMDRLLNYLAQCVTADEPGKFSEYWDKYSKDIEKGSIGASWVTDLHTSHLFESNRTEFSMDRHYIKLSFVHAVAAQRAHDRGEIEAAWALLANASYYGGAVEGLDLLVHHNENKSRNSKSASKNASVPGERFRYQIIGLLTREYSRPGWSSIDLALSDVKDDLKIYIAKNNLKIQYDDISFKIETWLDEYPAFKAEFKDFFVDGVI